MDQSFASQPLPKLVEALDRHLEESRYNRKYCLLHRRYARKLMLFAQSTHGTELYTPELMSAYLRHVGFPPPDYPCCLPHPMKHQVRLAYLLRELCLNGSFPASRGKECAPIPPRFQSVFQNYLADLEHRGYARQSISTRTLLPGFFLFLENDGVTECAQITAAHLSRYVGQLSGYAPASVAVILVNLRAFSRFLYRRGIRAVDLSTDVPTMRHLPQKMPGLWTREEVESLLAAIDRNCALGKRDYAMFLLAARLGMRSGDICRLRLEHLYWDAGRIEMIQSKTGRPLSLPLLQDVGAALIDYLRNGRPETEYREVLIRHCAPFTPLAEGTNSGHLLRKCCSIAGITTPAGIRRSFHSLRHTLASSLLEQRTPLPLISEILGHSDSQITRRYLKIDIESLRQCALD